MKAKMMGSGWHGETLRHSRAKKLGVAGGRYAKFERCVKVVKKQEGYNPYAVCRASTGYKGKTNPKTMTYKELKRTGHHLSPSGDADKDGVKNKEDCRPLDPKKQDNGQPAEEKKTFWDKVKEYKAQRAERAEQAKTEEHEARMKEIARLKEEIKELNEKKEAERLLEKEKTELANIKAERDRLRNEKLKAKIEATKKFLKPVGKFLKEEAKFALTGNTKTTRKGKKGKRRKKESFAIRI